MKSQAWKSDTILKKSNILTSDRHVPYYPFRIKQKENIWIIRNLITQQEYELNNSAYWLLSLCDGYRTLDEIITELSTYHNTDRYTILDLCFPLLEKLTKDGILWWRRNRMNFWKSPAPAGILWDLTSKCNLRCKHCVVSGGEAERDGLNTHQCFELINEFAEFGITQLILSGGEPMMRDDFFEIAEYAAKKEIFVQVATNGTLIDENASQRFARIDACLQVSLDSSEPSIHDQFRQSPGSWNKTIKGIKNLVQAGVPVTLAATVTTINIGNIPSLYKYAKELGVQTFRILPFIPFGRGIYAGELEVAPEMMRDITKLLFSKRKEAGPVISSMEFECTFSPPLDHKTNANTRIGCDGAISYCTITSEGDVLPCNYFAGAEVENVKDKSFRWIWDHSRFLNYFRSLKVSDIYGSCQQCDWLSTCRGSCLAANFAHKDIFQSNCHCWLANP